MLQLQRLVLENMMIPKNVLIKNSCMMYKRPTTVGGSHAFIVDRKKMKLKNKEYIVLIIEPEGEIWRQILD